MEAIETVVKKFNVSQILLHLNRNKKTGTLTVNTPVFMKKVYLAKGDAIFASSTDEDERLGETLLKLGKITIKQYERSVELLKETGKKQGAILVELGYLTPKDLILGVQYQVREIIYSLFLLKDAEYEFEEGELPSKKVITLQISMGKLIYEGLKRITNLVRIRRELPDMQAILQLSANPSDLLKDIALSPQDERMLSIIDGTKTASELIKSSSSDSFEAMKTLYVLYATGFIEEQNEKVMKGEQTVLSVETIKPDPEEGALKEESPEKQVESAFSETKEELLPSSEKDVESETKNRGNGDSAEHEITLEPISTTDLITPATAEGQIEASSGAIDEPEEKKDVEESRNRRRHKRFKVEGAEVNGEMLFTKEVNVLDMSMSGIALQTDRQLKIGREYLLNLQNEDKIISVKAIVVRSVLSESRTDISGDVIPLYIIGMQFTNISDEKINEIIQFIDNHKTGDQPKIKTNGKMEQRKCNRFPVNVDGKTILNFQELYTVKVISLNGMLIDSSHFLKIEDKLHMKIHLPQDKMIDFIGRVASCSEKDEGDQKRYDIGIEFIQMSEEHKEALNGFFENIEDIRKCDITAVQTEAPANEETSETPSLNTGDADLYVLQGKYADAMAIYNELLAKEPENVHVLKRIEALATLLTNLKDEKERPPRASGALATQTTEVRKRQTNGKISTDGSAELDKPKKNGSPHIHKEPLSGSEKVHREVTINTKKNGSPSRWYGKFVKRILTRHSDNSP